MNYETKEIVIPHMWKDDNCKCCRMPRYYYLLCFPKDNEICKWKCNRYTCSLKDEHPYWKCPEGTYVCSICYQKSGEYGHCHLFCRGRNKDIEPYIEKGRQEVGSHVVYVDSSGHLNVDIIGVDSLLNESFIRHGISPDYEFNISFSPALVPVADISLNLSSSS